MVTKHFYRNVHTPLGVLVATNRIVFLHQLAVRAIAMKLDCLEVLVAEWGLWRFSTAGYGAVSAFKDSRIRTLRFVYTVEL